MEENKPDEPPKVYRAFSEGREEFERERLAKQREPGSTTGRVVNIAVSVVLFWIAAGLLWVFLEGMLRSRH